MNLSEIQLGDMLSWLYTPKGGYGFTYPVDAEVKKKGRKKVQIEVKKINREVVLRWVDPANLRYHPNSK